MRIENLFEKDIFRPINGVVKADQLDESSIWQELDEFVVTKELDYGLSRMYEIMINGVSQSNAMVFRDYDEAMDWLCEVRQQEQGE